MPRMSRRTAVVRTCKWNISHNYIIDPENLQEAAAGMELGWLNNIT